MYPGGGVPTPVTTTAAPEEGLRGDANCDDCVDISDAVLILRCAVEDREAVITDQGKTNADADRDGKLSSDDVKLILQHIAKKINLNGEASVSQQTHDYFADPKMWWDIDQNKGKS